MNNLIVDKIANDVWDTYRESVNKSNGHTVPKLIIYIRIDYFHKIMSQIQGEVSGAASELFTTNGTQLLGHTVARVQRTENVPLVSIHEIT